MIGRDAGLRARSSARTQDGSPVDLTPCGDRPRYTRAGDYNRHRGSRPRRRPHALPPARGVQDRGRGLQQRIPHDRDCDFRNRNFELEFFNGNAQIFRNELAALVLEHADVPGDRSCDVFEDDVVGRPRVLQPAGRVEHGQVLLRGAAALRQREGLPRRGAASNRNKVLAGGNERFGRRDFIWHSGGELMLRYAQRNVFGSLVRLRGGRHENQLGSRVHLDRRRRRS